MPDTFCLYIYSEWTISWPVMTIRLTWRQDPDCNYRRLDRVLSSGFTQDLKIESFWLHPEHSEPCWPDNQFNSCRDWLVPEKSVMWEKKYSHSLGQTEFSIVLVLVDNNKPGCYAACSNLLNKPIVIYIDKHFYFIIYTNKSVCNLLQWIVL